MGILETANRNYMVTFWERDQPYVQLVAWLGDTPPTPSQGGGGYQPVTLPRRAAVTVWAGRDQPLLLDVPIMLWHYEEEPSYSTVTRGHGKHKSTTHPIVDRRESTTWQLRRIQQMWRPSDDTQPPPVIKCKAPHNLIPYQRLAFVLNDVTWGAAIGDESGTRIMQQLTLQLMEYREDEVLQIAKVKKRKHHHKVYVVKHGDTLRSIARKFHLKNGWKELGDAQHPQIHDPRKIRVGQRLVIPS